MSNALRFLLLQTRNADDPMIPHEVGCFAQALGCDAERITTHDLLAGGPSRSVLNRHDLVLLGGSGDYSAAAPIDDGQNAWLARALDSLRGLHALAKPTFASCWGFQAFCRAMGGDCLHDSKHAELGSVKLTLTPAGRDDPVFGSLPPRFLAFEGHQDRVALLPPDAVLLASSDLVAEQAVRFDAGPIYATQFHPELTRTGLIERVRAYPEYVERIAGLPMKIFEQSVRETPESNSLLRLMVEVAFG